MGIPESKFSNMKIEIFKKSQTFYKKITNHPNWNISRPFLFSGRNVSETSKSKFVTTYSGRTSYIPSRPNRGWVYANLQFPFRVFSSVWAEGSFSCLFQRLAVHTALIAQTHTLQPLVSGKQFRVEKFLCPEGDALSRR